MFENPRRGRQARNFTTNNAKILDLRSSSEQIFSRKLPLGAPVGIGISAIVLGALTATGLCVDEFCCSDSNPEEVPPGVTLGSPAVIYQPDR